MSVAFIAILLSAHSYPRDLWGQRNGV